MAEPAYDKFEKCKKCIKRYSLCNDVKRENGCLFYVFFDFDRPLLMFLLKIGEQEAAYEAY